MVQYNFERNLPLEICETFPRLLLEVERLFPFPFLSLAFPSLRVAFPSLRLASVEEGEAFPRVVAVGRVEEVGRVVSCYFSPFTFA